MHPTREKMVLDADLLSRGAARSTIGYWAERTAAQIAVTPQALTESATVIATRGRDRTERNAAMRNRDTWMKTMENHGALTHITNEAIVDDID